MTTATEEQRVRNEMHGVWRESEEVIHVLESCTEDYQATISGRRPWEYRYNDRGFLAGDLIELVETPGGRKQLFSIVFKVEGASYGLADGFCIMTLGAP